MRKLWVFLGAAVIGGAELASGGETADIYQGSVEDRVQALSSIQPGLGTIMHEYGNRFTQMYFAANGGNWGLAQYELKEMLEAQEIAEITRPKRAAMLKAFEENYLAPLGESIEKQNTAQFNQRFKGGVTGCNACHTALGYQFIQYRLPIKSGYDMLNFSLKTKPAYEEKKEYK